MKIKKAFCAICQNDTDHSAQIDQNNELVLTCSVCQHFIKVPEGIDAKSLNELLKAHKDANEGQVTVEQQQKKLDEVLG